MGILDFILIVLVVYVIVSFLKRKKKKGPIPIRTYSYIKCNRCGKTTQRLHKDFEYVMQELEKCKCGGTKIIEGIFAKKEKTEKEKKWEKFLEKWR